MLFFVKPLDGKGLVKQVNRQQMFDLGVMERQRREGESDQIEEDPEVPKAPVYHPRVKIAMKPQGQSISSLFKRASADTCTKGISCKESGSEA